MASVSAYAGSVGTGYDTSAGTTSWATTSNAIGSPTGSYATTGLPTSGESKSLDLYNFNPGVPSGATINGLQITIQALKTGTHPVLINHGHLFINGSGPASPTTTTADSSSLTSTVATYTWGSSTDLWGLSSSNWTAALVNGSTEGTDLTFCVYCSAALSGGAEVNGIQATVYYTLSGNSGGLTPLFNSSTVLTPLFNANVLLYDPFVGL